MLSFAHQQRRDARFRSTVPTNGEAQPIEFARAQQRASGAVAASEPLAAALARAVSDRAGASQVLQRKVVWKPERPYPDLLFEELKKHEAALTSKSGGAKLTLEAVRKGLARLENSAEDYGTFVVDSDQDLALLYYEMLKHDVAPKERAPDNEIAASQAKQRGPTSQWTMDKLTTPGPSRTYELALLGTGASVAYWITTHKHEIDRSETVVIGKKQPWAGERGPGVINHPEHMVTALRDEVGLGDEKLFDRARFSEIVRQVIEENVDHERDATIETITKIKTDGGYFYEIAIDLSGEKLKYYARRVVAGLGIGGHAPPRPREGEQGAQQPLDGRAMDMDEFQRRAEDIAKASPGATVVITGPNAGIDVVKTAIELGFEINWVTGSGRPGFLPGTDNELVEREYDLCEKGKKSKIARIIKARGYLATQNPAYDEQATQGFKSKPIVVDMQDLTIFADYYVWAMGPSLEQTKKVFKDLALEPTYDVNRQFERPGLEEAPIAVVGLQARRADGADTSSLEIVGGAAFRLAETVAYGGIADGLATARDATNKAHGLRSQFETAKGGVDSAQPVHDAMVGLLKSLDGYVAALGELLQKIAGAKADTPRLTAVAAPDLRGDLAIIESFAKRHRKHPEWAGLAELARSFASYARHVARYGDVQRAFIAQLNAYLDENRPPPYRDPRKASGQMGKVISSLPINVLMNDQLTPSRSQVEASGAFVPGYVRTDANFATDSATVLQIHISVAYPYLSDEQVDFWVDRIIRWRRPSDAERNKYTKLWGPIPNPNGADRENAVQFTEWFKYRLDEENTAARDRALLKV